MHKSKTNLSNHQLRVVRFRHSVRRTVRRAQMFIDVLIQRRIVPSQDLLDIIEKEQNTASQQVKPVILCAFHVPHMYSLISMKSYFNKPIICLSTKEAVSFLGLVSKYSSLIYGVEFVENLHLSGLRRIIRGQAILLVFVDTIPKAQHLIHLNVFGRTHNFSASWAVLALGVGARVITLIPIRQARSVLVNAKESLPAISEINLCNDVFKYFEETIKSVSNWDMINYRSIYPPSVDVDQADALHRLVRFTAGSSLELLRMLDK